MASKTRIEMQIAYFKKKKKISLSLVPCGGKEKGNNLQV